MLLLLLPLFAAVSVAADVTITKLSVKASNAYLIGSKPPVLVDAGNSGGEEKLTNALKEQGLDLKSLGWVVFTHGHNDHAGLGAYLQSQGVKIAAGKSDLALTTVGHNDELHATSFFSGLLKPFVSASYPPYTPDDAIDAELDLRKKFGPEFPDVRVVPMPGHTQGSLVLLLNPDSGGAYRDAIVGDMVLGGSMGGAFWSTCPREHYFHWDREKNLVNIRSLLARGVKTFYLGHGGPVVAADVEKEFGK